MSINGNIQSIQNGTWKLEPWTLIKKYSSEMSDFLSKREYFQKPRMKMVGSSQWQVPVISIFWVIWGKASDRFGGKGGYGYTQKRLHVFLRWVFCGNFP